MNERKKERKKEGKEERKLEQRTEKFIFSITKATKKKENLFNQFLIILFISFIRCRFDF
jgi:hypothetical protein